MSKQKKRRELIEHFGLRYVIYVILRLLSLKREMEV
jgi:hypothetical protein